MAIEIKESIDLSKINELFGAYHRTQYPRIVEKFKANDSLDGIFPSITMLKDELTVIERRVKSIMQPFQKSWTPKGGIGFFPEVLKLRYAKADQEVDPNDLRNTYMASYLEGAPSEENEIVRMAFEQNVQQASIDTVDALINGVYKIPTSGEAGDALDAVDGYKEFIRKQIVARKITPLDLGEINQTNAIEKVEALYQSIPAQYRGSKKLGTLICYVSEAFRRQYFFAYRDQLGILANYEGWNGMVDATNIKMVELPSMGNYNRIVFTMEGNFVQLAGKPTDRFKFEIEKHHRVFDFMMDWSMGFGALIVGEADVPENQYIWCNKIATDPTVES